VVAYATGWGWPGLMTFTVVDANRGTAAASSSVVQAGVFVGAGATPIVLGTAVERWGFDAVWVIVAAALLAGAGVARFIGRDAAADRV
ncbi:MAG: MFS transporter, partial [Acidimicrobiia bacterium]|nr:MFS transporter [Acidimicrobiia bacterium]